MKKLSQIEVEPLSEQRWSKIERSLVSRLALETNDATKRWPEPRSRRAGRTWLLAAALVGALGMGVLATRALPERPAIEQPSRVTTGATSSHLALSGLSLDVEPQSAVVVGAETPQGLLIVVDRGSIVCQVAPRPSDAPLIVQAGAARVRVLGTRFSVTRLGESARVMVQEGIVEVSSGGRIWHVRGGEVWPTEVAAATPPELVHVPNVLPPTVVEDVERGAPPPEPPVATATKPRSAPEIAAPEGTSARPSSEPRSSSRQAVFEKATALERSDPRHASELYGTLETGGDSWAQNALYARGRLEASRGNRVEARRLLERYLEQYPSGTNAEDARAVLKRLR
jgi:FecR protein